MYISKYLSRVTAEKNIFYISLLLYVFMCRPHWTLVSHFKEDSNTHTLCISSACLFRTKRWSLEVQWIIEYPDGCIVRKLEVIRGNISDQGRRRWDILKGLSGFFFPIIFTVLPLCCQCLPSSSLQSWNCLPVTTTAPVCDAFSASHSPSGRLSQELTRNHETNCFIWAFCLKGQKLSLFVGREREL